jgi:hypothetical protein|tara:strand:- start:3635 stop:3811 length:177 start_codon:yes stop_codon:yes gene_type:complete
MGSGRRNGGEGPIYRGFGAVSGLSQLSHRDSHHARQTASVKAFKPLKNKYFGTGLKLA